MNFTITPLRDFLEVETIGLDLTRPFDREIFRKVVDRYLSAHPDFEVRSWNRTMGGYDYPKMIHVKRAIADAWIAQKLELPLVEGMALT